MTIFNVLDHLPEQPVTTLESTSSLYNEKVGYCPKCGSAMTISRVANGDEVFFCTKDRVVAPQPDNLA